MPHIQVCCESGFTQHYSFQSLISHVSVYSLEATFKRHDTAKFKTRTIRDEGTIIGGLSPLIVPRWGSGFGGNFHWAPI